jgi:hypothetical protein
MTGWIFLYLCIGALIALIVLKVIRDPPDLGDADTREWRSFRQSFQTAPEIYGPLLFGLLLFIWPVVFFGPLFSKGDGE